MMCEGEYLSVSIVLSPSLLNAIVGSFISMRRETDWGTMTSWKAEDVWLEDDADAPDMSCLRTKGTVGTGGLPHRS